MTQSQLAQRVGVTKRAVHAWLVRGRVPALQARKVERILKKPSGWLLDVDQAAEKGLEWELVKASEGAERGEDRDLVDRETAGSLE